MPRNLDWTGAADHMTFDTAGNWNDLATGVAALAVPATGDSCYISQTADLITANLNQTGVTLVNFVIGPGFTGQMGTSGTSLTIAATTFSYNGRATLFNITAGTAGITTATIGGSGTVSLTGGTTTNLHVGPSGNCYVGPSAVVTTLRGAGGGINATSGTAFTTTKMKGGVLTSARNLGTLLVSGNGTLVKTTGLATITTGDVESGARLNHTSTGTITTLEVAGTADAQGAYVGFTVTTLRKYNGSSAFDGEMATITITNPVVPVGNLFDS